jgi:hypothetical protein
MKNLSLEGCAIIHGMKDHIPQEPKIEMRRIRGIKLYLTSSF